jgi:hypothetical protein
LHERLLLRNEQTKQVQLPDVYIQTDASRKNVSAWMNAQYIYDAAPNILPVSWQPETSTDPRLRAAA